VGTISQHAWYLFHTLKGSLRNKKILGIGSTEKVFKTKNFQSQRDKPECVYKIPCRCGIEYIRQTDH
jgi:chemotaxis methyl-accepting protein methylase